MLLASSFLNATGQQRRYTTGTSLIFVSVLVLGWCLCRAGSAAYALPVGLASVVTCIIAAVFLNAMITCPSCGGHPIRGALNKMAHADVGGSVSLVPLLEACPYCDFPRSSAAGAQKREDR